MTPDEVTHQDFERHRDKIDARLVELERRFAEAFTGSANERLKLERMMVKGFNDIRSTIESGFDELRKELKSEYVTKAEFEPVKRVVYGLIGIILVAVVGAIVALVL